MDTLVMVLPMFGLAWGVHWLREYHPAWWPGNRES